MAEPLPDLMNLQQVLERLRGTVGRSRLLDHLAAFPMFAGGATHGRLGRKYVFSPEQYRRLVESLSQPRQPAAIRYPNAPLPNADRAYASARALADRLLQNPKAARNKLKPRGR
jgi:hypothetical protein